MLLTQYASLMQCVAASNKSPRIVDYHATTRTLIRGGCDLEITSDYLQGLVPHLMSNPLLAQLEKPVRQCLPQSLVDCATFLCDQGLKVDSWRPASFIPIWICAIPPPIHSSDFERITRQYTVTIFMRCLLKADDVSIGGEDDVWQALDILKVNKSSAGFASHFMNLAYYLICFGGVDVSASARLAFRWGCLQERKIVSKRCGFVYKGVLKKEKKLGFLGNGESTAVDTEDLVQDPGSVTRRRPVTGDRLEDEDLDS